MEFPICLSVSLLFLKVPERPLNFYHFFETILLTTFSLLLQPPDKHQGIISSRDLISSRRKFQKTFSNGGDTYTNFPVAKKHRFTTCFVFS